MSPAAAWAWMWYGSELTRADITAANGKHLANVRGELIPYIRLREHFGIPGERPEIEQIMVVETGQGRYGFVVDCVLGNCQTVIKNLGRFYRHVQVVSGATILGNGTVALILDPERLAQDAVQAIAHTARGHPAGAAEKTDRREELSSAKGKASIGGAGQSASTHPSTT